MLLVTLAALFASALAVSAAMATAIFERRTEVGLMKALGAGSVSVAALFFAEALLLALIGGVVGFAGGALLARQIGRSIFDSQITIDACSLPRDPGHRRDRDLRWQRDGDSPRREV